MWHAVVIGVDTYPYLPTIKLNGCVADASAMRDFLVERVRIPEGRLTLLTSPAPAPAQEATSANIRAALRALTVDGAVRRDDHVVLFYACHGIRITREKKGADDRDYYGMIPADVIKTADGGYENLVLDREINGFLRAMQRRGVGVTVIADTCQSGAATRGIEDEPGARYLKDVAPLSEVAWSALHQSHPALSDSLEADRLATGFGKGADFVVLSACKPNQKAFELEETVLASDGARKTVKHGALTLGLLDALQAIPAEQVQTLRWMDFYENLSRAVTRRVQDAKFEQQHPSLEGDPARPVFGGRWKPFEPGFTARRSMGAYNVNGGALHGLDVGAEIALYPSDTPSFDAAADLAVGATIIAATLSTSTAKLINPARKVGDSSRVRLVKPAQSWTPMRVRLVDVTPEVVEAAHLDKEATQAFVRVVAPGEPAHVEVRPWSGEVPEQAWYFDPTNDQKKTVWKGAHGGWVLVSSDEAGAPSMAPAGFDAKRHVIAYLPAETSPRGRMKNDRSSLGAALREGLVRYARYLRTRDLVGGDDVVRAMLGVKLRAGLLSDVPTTQRAGGIDTLVPLTSYVDPKDGVHAVFDDQFLFLEMAVLQQTRSPLQVGVVFCADDGSVVAQWPPRSNSEYVALRGTEYVGVDRFKPLVPTVRADQTVSRWTLKVIACVASGPSRINLEPFEQLQSVQELFAERLELTRAPPTGHPGFPAKPGGYVWNVHLAIGRRSP